MALFHSSFAVARDNLAELLRTAPLVRTERWQGVEANQSTRECLNVDITVPLTGIENLEYWREDIQPNLPWADDHFLERVGGEPLNPGEQWKNWPWSGSAARFRSSEGVKFNHTYMERLWPKYARRTEDGRLPNFSDDPASVRKYPSSDFRPKRGITWEYGDLQDLVELLAKEPHTRQAWIPLFFPEDTGKGDGGRKPCTLGYQIIVRDGRAHIWYPLRSCDFVRHWPDDCYLAVRLLLWIIDRCRDLNPDWKEILPGTYSMHMTSLHIFEGDKV